MKPIFVGVSRQQPYQVLMAFVVESFQANHLVVYLFFMRGIVSFFHLKLFDSEEKIIVRYLNILLALAMLLWSIGRTYVASASIVVGWVYLDFSHNRISSQSMHSKSDLGFCSSIVETVLHER